MALSEHLPLVDGAPPIPRSMRVFNQWERGIIRALSVSIIGESKRFRLSVDEAGVVDLLDAFMATAQPHMRLGYRALLWLLEVGSVLPWLGGLPFSLLGKDAQKAYVHAIHDSPYFLPRALLRALTTLVFMLFYEHPKVAAKLGYEAPKPRSDAPRGAPAGAANLTSKDAPVSLTVDAVVVGSGAGGAAAAYAMARAGMKVLILEDGAFVGRGEFTGHALDMTRLTYRDDGVVVALGKPGILLPVGRVAGGTTTINSGTSFRTPNAVLEEWRAQKGLEDLSPANLAKHFDEVEHVLGVAPMRMELMGKGGEVVARGARALGYRPFPLPRNAPDCQGSGMCCWGCPTGAKRSANESWLPMATALGAQLLCNVKVDRVVMEGSRAVGVEGHIHGGAAVHVKAKHVVLAAGTLHTPLLLKESGVRSPALGQHLTMHPATKCMALFDEELHAWKGVPQSLGVDAPGLDGIKFEGAFVPPSVGAVALPFLGERHTSVMEQYDHLATYGFMVKDNPNGWLMMQGGRVQAFYTPGPMEMERIRRGVVLVAGIFLAAGAKRVITPVSTFPEVCSQADLERLANHSYDAGEIELSAFHPLGTARMDANPEEGVCDVHGAVHGTQGLHIADGSAVPSSLGVNPQVTIMALALRLGARLAALPQA